MSTHIRTALAAAAAATVALVLAGLPSARSADGPGATLVSGPDMHRDRIRPGVASLSGGRVLVFGGHGGGNFAALNTAEIWTEAGGWNELTMNAPRDTAAIAELADGRFLLAGGSYDLGTPGLASAEIFDPATETFVPIASMRVARAGCAAATLTSGKVLVVGGWYNDTAAGWGDVWDPSTGEWTMTEPLVTPRAYPIVVPCDDGTAMVFSGMSPYGSSAYRLAEVYDPATNTFTALDPGVMAADGLIPEIFDFTSPIGDRRMADGRYLFVAGIETSPTGDAALFTFDPATKTFAALTGGGVLPGGVAWFGPLVDGAGDTAYVPVVDHLVTGDFGWAAVDLVTGQTNVPESYVPLPNDQYMSYSGRTVLADGRLFIAGGYHRRVMTNYAGSMSLLFATPDAGTVITAPAVPEDVAVAPDGGTTAVVTWTHDPPAAEGFLVERRQLPSGTWTAIPGHGPDVRMLTDTGLVRGAAYEYHICAFNAAGSSEWTPAVGVTMPGGHCTASKVLRFGTIRAGQTRVRSVLVRNTSRSQALTVRVTGVTGPFWEGAGPGLTAPWTTIPKRRSARISVTFGPELPGVARGVLTLESSDAKHPATTVRLLGRAKKAVIR